MRGVSSDAPWRGQGDIIRTRHSESGKGDRQRPSEIDEKTQADNWCVTFGHRRRTAGSATCWTCKARLESSQ